MHRRDGCTEATLINHSSRCCVKRRAYLSRMPEAGSPAAVQERQLPASFIMPGNRLLFLNCRNGRTMLHRNPLAIMLRSRQQGLPPRSGKPVTLNVAAVWFLCCPTRMQFWQAFPNRGTLALLRPGSRFVQLRFLHSARTGWRVQSAHFICPGTPLKRNIEREKNLIRMLQEIPLTEVERAAMEDGIEAMTRLTDSLQKVATPG